MYRQTVTSGIYHQEVLRWVVCFPYQLSGVDHCRQDLSVECSFVSATHIFRLLVVPCMAQQARLMVLIAYDSGSWRWARSSYTCSTSTAGRMEHGGREPRSSALRADESRAFTLAGCEEVSSKIRASVRLLRSAGRWEYRWKPGSSLQSAETTERGTAAQKEEKSYVCKL